MKHLNLIFSLALGTLLMSCDSDAFLSPTDNATTRGIEYATGIELSSSPKPEVSASEARKVAESLLASSTSIYKVQSTSRSVTSVRPITDAAGNTLMYIISYDNGGGYAIVSGTKKYTSVLAYSETGSFDETAGGQKDWLEAMKKTISQYASDANAKWNIDWLKYENLPQSTGTAVAAYASEQPISWWQHQTMTEVSGKDETTGAAIKGSDTFCSLDALSRYVSLSNDYFAELISRCQYLGYQKSDIFAHVIIENTTDNVGPLLTTSWHQKTPYIDNASDRLGCVTVAIGQLMYYYKQPASFNWTEIGKYGSSAQQAFLKGIGERLGFDYSNIKGKRGATIDEARDALKSYGYNVTTATQPNYAHMAGNIANKKPFICGGVDLVEGGHAWVVDGCQYKGQQYYIRIYAPTVSKPSNGMFTSNPYRYFSEYNQSEGTSQYYFHMNWGWGPGTSSWNIAGDYTTGNLDFGNKNALFYIK